MEFPHTTVIPVTTDISDRKNMKFLWNDGANALVNAAEGIILQRQNVVNSAGEIKDGINIAYAFEAGVSAEQRKRVEWTLVGKDQYEKKYFLGRVSNLPAEILLCGDLKTEYMNLYRLLFIKTKLELYEICITYYIGTDTCLLWDE